MKAVVFRSPGEIGVEEWPEPSIEQPGDAIVRVTLAGICEYDVLAYDGKRPRHPGTIGHQFAGVIEAVGDGAGAIKVGQRVVSPPSVSCGGCFYCKQGLLSACDQVQFFERQLPGAQAQYVRVPNAAAVLETLPDALPDEQAVFVSEQLPAALGALELAGLKAGESVAVAGCRPAGLATLLMAQTMGAGRVFAIDSGAHRLAAAAQIGATALNPERDDIEGTIKAATGGRGVDIAIEAEGTAAALSQTAALARPWGTLLSLGYGIEVEAQFAIGRLTARHVRLIPAGFLPVKNHMAAVAKMIARRVIDAAPLVSHTLALEEAPRAYAMLSEQRDGALSVLLRP
jgi:threonine dehydrogenase-like Zn-dependent dehydrogenase